MAFVVICILQASMICMNVSAAIVAPQTKQQLKHNQNGRILHVEGERRPPNPPNPDASSSRNSLIIAAIASGGVVLLAIVISLCICCSRMRHAKRCEEKALQSAVGDSATLPNVDDVVGQEMERRESTPWGHPPDTVCSFEQDKSFQQSSSGQSQQKANVS